MEKNKKLEECNLTVVYIYGYKTFFNLETNKLSDTPNFENWTKLNFCPPDIQYQVYDQIKYN